MSGKRKTALLVGVLVAVFLGLYRNFGVPILRFWPLILIDTLTRFPGDRLIEILLLRIPESAYEFLRGLLQIPMVILLGWGAARSIGFLRGKRRK
ncbi:MAG TPA: hypothetical protein VLJ16_10740, partial [Acidobacteriota bacterium]|nr:hypothetical protein [Acidobacteriota bacterium]